MVVLYFLNSSHMSLGHPYLNLAFRFQSPSCNNRRAPEIKGSGSRALRGEHPQRSGLSKKLLGFYVQALPVPNKPQHTGRSPSVRSLFDLGWDVTLTRRKGTLQICLLILDFVSQRQLLGKGHCPWVRCLLTCFLPLWRIR